MKRCEISAAILVICLSAARPAAAAQSWRATGQIGGPTQTVAVQGNYAYVGTGLRLTILDITNPADMREVGVTPSFSSFVEGVAVSGTTAYVAAGSSGLHLIDVSNPAFPTEIGEWDSRGSANGVAVAGSTAYLADGPYGLRVLDVSKPSQPIETGAAYVTSNAMKVAVQGHTAYIAAAGGGLLIADVGDSQHPVEVGAIATGGYAYGVAVAGSTAYVAAGWEGLKIVDVGNPGWPVAKGAFKTAGWAFDVAVANGRATVAEAPAGLRVIDVADPAHPVQVAQCAIANANPSAVTVAGNVAYVADRFAGLRSVNLTTGPSPVGLYRSLNYADAVAVSGDRAYVGSNSGLEIIDLSDVTRPRQLGSVDLGGYATSVALSGTIVCVAMGAGGGGQGLRTVDVSDPRHPRVVATHSRPPGAYRDMVVSDGIAYGANEWGLETVRLSDPSSPEWLGFLQLQSGYGTAVGVAVSGKTAYAASSGAGVVIVDVSDPRNPAPLASIGAGKVLAQDVAAAGSRVYAAGFSVVLIVDASNPSQPSVMGSVTTPGQAYGIAVDGPLVYVADGDRGLTVVDASDPSRPSILGNFDTAGFAHEAVPAGGRVFVADGLGGLLIFEKAALSETAALTATARNFESSETRAALFPPPHSRVAAAPAPADHVREIAPAAGPCIVSTTADTGSGSLRACLEGGASSITFDTAVFPKTSPATIRVTAALPLKGGTMLDASNAGVILDGSGLTQSPAPGLLLIQSDHNVVRGLQILGFPNSGIEIDGSDNTIEGNVISGNRSHAIAINGLSRSASNNVVVGNLIGTDSGGTKALGNGHDAVFVSGGATGNRIGGTAPGERNVISGNAGSGITFAGATGNLAVGNYLGTDVTGTAAIPNGNSGVTLEGGSTNNVVAGNLASGNKGGGITIGDWGTSYNSVVGNLIGTDATGTKAIPNGLGIFLGFMGGSFNRIGGLRPEERNIIGGNGGNGINIQGPAAIGNLVLGNAIGTDVTGQRALGNDGFGLRLTDDSRSIVGGATLAEGNVIGANRWSGINVHSDDNLIVGNIVGADALWNTVAGIDVSGARTTIQGNVIAQCGSGIVTGPLLSTVIRRNSIYSNGGKGIHYSGSGGPAAPTITSADGSAVAGTACPRCEVEVFSDSEDEGRVFEGSSVADAEGRFTLAAQRFLIGPYVTATATDAKGNTSEFSSPVPAPPAPPRRRAVGH